MKNSEIIKNLVDNYLTLKNENKDQQIVFDEEFYNKSTKKFNERNLMKFDEEGIDLILIGDNPGNAEKKNNEYFSKKGNAGKFARTFLDVYSQFHPKGKENFNFIIFNKTPFTSPTTDKLKTNNCILKSIEFLISALIQLSKVNSKVKILIVGYTKGNKLNKLFYNCLYDKITDNLLDKLRFAKHFSHGNFFNQWLEHDYVEIKKISEINPEITLQSIHNETIKLIDIDLKLNFELKLKVLRLNQMMNEQADKLISNSVASPEILEQMVTISDSFTKVIDFYKITPNLIEELALTEDEMKTINQFEQDVLDIKEEQSNAVKKKDFELAARYRDEIRSVEVKRLNKILDFMKLYEGFNLFKKDLLIVKPNDSLRAKIVDEFLNKKC